ncbi:hypothetical protein BV091_00613 [Haemophilus influenzae]|nr:hypothetical protein BV143_00199 [Haemophilus influenzae]PRK91641.1 hypothetical protein BV142_01069 [Haemophilus influenzae]PRL41081.1 hypothetical protein BV091_00613 [Haemophilus influenzae]PRL44583.1 hypothetical protein BV090_00187 [Haemophilus influenzae]
MLSSDLIVPPEVVVKIPCSAFTVTLFLAVTLDTVKLLSFAVILTESPFASTAPCKLPSFTDISTEFVVALMVESFVVVNLPLSAVIVTVPPEILLTARVSPVATSVTEPELDSTLPLILPIWVVILALPVVALIVEPSVVVTAPEVAVTVTF